MRQTLAALLFFLVAASLAAGAYWLARSGYRATIEWQQSYIETLEEELETRR